MENNGNLTSREKIDQVAMWLGSTVSSAFFSSLERFSCVNIATSDPDNDDDDDDYYSTTANTPTAASTALATTTVTTSPPSVQVNNGQSTNDVSNLPIYWIWVEKDVQVSSFSSSMPDSSLHCFRGLGLLWSKSNARNPGTAVFPALPHHLLPKDKATALPLSRILIFIRSV
ncbi:hypothetical protein CR513_35623, partial [Mucuna pruriens]